MDEGQDTVVLEKLLISVVQKILERARSLVIDEILHSWKVLQLELNQIHNSLTMILSLLRDAEDSTLTGLTKPFSVWLEKLKTVAHEAEDVLDDLAYHNLKQKVPNSNPIFKSFHLFKNAFNFKLLQKIRTLNESLGKIRNEAIGFRFDFQFRSGDDRKMIRIDLDQVLDLVIEDTVVGRETDVSNIVSLLCFYCGQQKLTVVSIVGIHGLGKTTLAKLVCEQVMARKLFDVNIWLCCTRTSDEDLESILWKVLRSVNRELNCPMDRDTILQELKREFQRKKCLLVIDNARFDAPKWWSELKTRLLEVFKDNGNSVLVTSNNEDVASEVDTSPQHRYALDFLSDEDCWFIMKERAFRNSKTEISGKLEEIGRGIAMYCRGVPLVAKLIGGTVGFSMDEESWLRIRDEIALLENHLSNNLLSMLVLSFNQLPSNLKLSLIFCLDFPKGFPIRREELIQLWMVEGFVDSCDQGDKYFSALLESSFFHDVEMSDDGNVIRFKMPDILPYFAYELVNPVIRSWMISPAIGTFSGRHLYVDNQHLTNRILPESLGEAFQELRKLKSLRSINFHGDDIEELPSSVGKLRHLRYLSVSNTKIRVLPESVSKLYHLQSLNISSTRIEALPELIFKLQNLQTLNLSDSYMVDLPESITKLHRLQNLNVSNTSIKELPKFISKLQKLQTLNISNSSIKEFPESMAMLQNLKILNISNSKIVELPEFITKLKNLEILNVSHCNIKEFPESIANLCKLQTLKFLECKRLSKFPKQATSYLINLKNISFSYERQMPFGLGLLTSLQTLPFFVVGRDLGGSIGQLESLNELRGQLEITQLEEVQDKEEAKRAYLQGKMRLRGLGFQWSNGAIGRISKDEEQIECLQPNRNIRRIKIKYYMGKKWPSWMFKTKCPTLDHSLKVIDNLVELELEHCWNSVKLPRLGDLPYLKLLRMSHMRRVKCIDNDFYGTETSTVFPSLKSLSVSWMESLTEWISPSNSSAVVVFPCLEHLSIQSCAKLASFPFADLSALVKMEIKNCEELRFILHKQQSFSHLNSLSVVGCPKLAVLRNWLLPNLCFRDFSFSQCQWLIFVPKELGKLNSLSSLHISCCKRLKCFSEEILFRLAQLKHLSIGAFSEELDDFRYLNRINDLQWLEELDIWGSDVFRREMSILPGQLQGLTGLKSLKIMGFTTMEVLPEWLVNLQSLESLSLNHCRKLGCQSATAIIQLPRLADLYIRNCPVLEENGSEWLLILNTKNIKVEFSNARSSNH